MAHSLILGMTESGKTTLAKRLAAQYSDKFNILVLDPLVDPEWPADFITDNPDEFLKVFWDNQNCMVFIDEAGESAGQYDTTMIRTATRGRHWGHSCHYLSQRGALMSKTIRGQCTNIFLFNSSFDDCKELSKDFNAPLLLEGVDLQQGEFIQGARFKPFTKMRVF